MTYLDTNILLEVLLPGRHKNAAVIKFLNEISDGTCISMLSVHLVYYFCRQYKISNELLNAVISRHTMAALTAEDYAWAYKHEAGRDFEDALQVATAVRMGCDSFVTLDRGLAKNYKRYLPITVP